MALKMKEERGEMFGEETYLRLKNEFGENLSDFVKYITTPPEKRKKNEDYDLIARGLERGKDGKYYDMIEFAKMQSGQIYEKLRSIPQKTKKPAQTAAAKKEEITFTEEEEIKPEKSVAARVGTPFGDLWLRGKNTSDEEIKECINNRAKLEKGIKDGKITEAEFRNNKYNLVNETDRKKILDLLFTRPIGVDYPVKEIKTEYV